MKRAAFQNMLIFKMVTGWLLVIGLFSCTVGPGQIGTPEADNFGDLQVKNGDVKSAIAPSQRRNNKDDDWALLEKARRLREAQPELFQGAKGVMVLGVVTGSLAEKAGFKRGDIVVRYQGQPISFVGHLINKASKALVSERIDVDIVHDGRMIRQSVHGGKLGIEIRKIPSKWEKELSQLSQAGAYAYNRSDFRKALTFWEPGLAKAQSVSDQEWIGKFLNNLGVIFRNSGQYERAIEYLQQALVIKRDIGDRRGEGDGLNNLGAIYGDRGYYSRALDLYTQALTIQQEIKDRRGESASLNGIGGVYLNFGQYMRAIDFFQKSLAIKRDLSNPWGIGKTLTNLSLTYKILGQYANAIDYSNRALKVQRKASDFLGMAISLNNLGMTYNNLGQSEQAIDSYNQALEINRKIDDQNGEGGTLNNLGEIYRKLGDYSSANNFYQQSLSIHRRIGDRRGEGSNLINLGAANLDLGETDNAIDFLNQAQVIQSEIKAPESQWRIWSTLLDAHLQRTQPETAAFYGKQAVNVIQTLRAHVATLDKDLQKSFLKDKEFVYRDLADLLFDQGRLNEAEQVMIMLKEEEQFDFLGRDFSQDNRHTQVAYIMGENRLKKQHDTFSQNLSTLNTELEKLQQKRKLGLSERENVRITQLQTELEQKSKALEDFLGELDNAIADFSIEDRNFPQESIEQLARPQKTLKQLGQNTVLVRYLVTDDKLRILVTTPDRRYHRDSTIKLESLNALIQDYRNILQNPLSQPLPLANKLYSILIAPIADELEKDKVKTLMVSLDAALRYLPLAALHDGNRYLVERYDLSIYTAAAKTTLSKPPISDWRVAGLGVSEKTEGFSALPSVVNELNGIVKEDDQPDPNGVLPGIVRLNGAFTRAAFKKALDGPYPVIHIASHFVFQPGNQFDSFLLFGKGEKLTLADLNQENYLLTGVDLFTLSACETAMGGDDANGREIESIGTLIQNRGAKAVLATLWPIADQSTGIFMQNFYRIRAEHPSISKANALRQAQIVFLSGNGIKNSPSDSDRGAIDPDDPTPTAIPHGSTGDYAHPYYWAPFILMGNWL